MFSKFLSSIHGLEPIIDSTSTNNENFTLSSVNESRIIYENLSLTAAFLPILLLNEVRLRLFKLS